MIGRLVWFPSPSDATVTLRPDSGGKFIGRSEIVAGRPASVMAIDEDTPDGWAAELTVERDGYVAVVLRGVLWLSRLNHVDSATFEVDDVRLTENPTKPLPQLMVEGQFFRLSTGERWTAIECSDFSLLARLSCGEDIEPVLRQRAACGFNLLRVWTLMRLKQWGIDDLDPCPYELVPVLCKKAARHGLRIEFTAYTGIRNPDHWPRLCLAAQGTGALLELVNENDQAGNHIDTTHYGHPGNGLLCSHGSNGSGAIPVEPFWDYATFHTNGQSEEQRKVGHNAMEIWNGPTLTNETSRCPQVGMWSNAIERVKQLAFDSAAGAALLCAGSCFHSVVGKASQLWTGIELEAARAWAEGAKSVPMEYQAGHYYHAIELEGSEYLRVYQRILPDGRRHTVRIRN